MLREGRRDIGGPVRFISALFLCAIAVVAQTADVSGIVRDPSGAFVPNAIMRIKNEVSGVERSVRSSVEGVYSITLLPPSRYTVSATAPGFQSFTREHISLEIGQSARVDFELQLVTAGQSITVSAESSLLRTDSAAVSTVINRRFLETLPLNGRSFQTLIALTPGVVMTKADFGEQGQFSVNGQRANANYFTIDGASANIGVSAGLTLVQGASGSLPGLGTTGGTNTLVAVESMQEFRVQTSTYAPEYGRMPGAQISILTRSGTNAFHGSLFEFFRNDALDANDWFANAERLPKPALRQNNFGGVFGGPVQRNRTFFFLSYEALRLRQPQVQVTDVPSLQVRSDAPRALRPYLRSFPLPNRTDTRFGFSPFVASYTDASSLDAASVRIDHLTGDRVSFFGRVNYAPSKTTARQFALNNPTDTLADTTTITLGSTALLSTSVNNDLRFNFSETSGESYSRLDTFGGAEPLPSDIAFPSFAAANDAFFGFFLQGGVSASYYLGKNVANRQRQFNLVDAVSVSHGSHQIKFGADFRRIATFNGARSYNQFAYFTTGSATLSGRASSVVVEAQDPGSIYFHNFSLYGQDAWKARSNLTITYGLRWEVNPPPNGGDNHPLYTFENQEDPGRIRIAPKSTRLYETTWNNFAPRIGAALQLKSWTLRGGFGMFYDLGAGLLGQAASSWPYYRQRVFFDGAIFPLPEEAAPPPEFSLDPPVVSIYGASAGLKMPVTYQWNTALERALGTNNSISLGYVAAAGRRLLRMDYHVNPNDDFTYAYLVRNTAFSDFHSLQAQFQRRMSKGLQALVSYTWGHSLDNASNDSASHLIAQQIDPRQDRGSSDFDIRQTLSGAFTYEFPRLRDSSRWLKAAANGWALDGVIAIRTGTPIDVTFYRDLGFGLYNFRPDRVAGAPLYRNDSNVAGGRRFNPDAFELQEGFPGRQGTLGRNVMRGFALKQANLGVRREFALHEIVRLQFRAEMFNVTNTPSFADPSGSLFSPQFGYSVRMLGRSLGRGGVNGGLNPLYQVGGPRSIQLALRVVF